MDNKSQKVSYLVPSYNHEKYIEKCIDSILDQSYKNIEIIICDDGSIDNTKNKLRKYENKENIKILFNEKNKGLNYTLNKLLGNSTGSYICVLASDDYIFKKKTELQLKIMIDKKLDILVAPVFFKSKTFKFYKIKNLLLSFIFKREEKIYEKIFSKNSPFLIQAGMFKADILKKYGFLEKYKNDDWLLLVRLALSKKKIYFYNKYLTFYRLHSTNTHNNYIKLSKEYIQPIIKDFIPDKFKIRLYAEDEYNLALYYLMNIEIIKSKIFLKKAIKKDINIYYLVKYIYRYFIFKMKGKI